VRGRVRDWDQDNFIGGLGARTLNGANSSVNHVKNSRIWSKLDGLLRAGM
jgi:hypothetical protein